MKILTSCRECSKLDDKLSEEIITVPMNNDGIFEIKCSKGHKFLLTTQESKFEILFDFGVEAFIDGYNREAISSIATSLERFYEFYTRVICIKHDVDIEKFNATWKYVSNQSERQYGGYLFSYLIENKTKDVLIIDNKKANIKNRSISKTEEWKKFRNNVVHKGYIPTNEEVIAYGNLVLKHINELIKELRDNCGDEIIHKADFQHLSRVHKKNADNLLITFSSNPTIISLSTTEYIESFEEGIENLKKWKRFINKHEKN